MYLTMHENNFFFATVYRSCSDFNQLKSKTPIFSPTYFLFLQLFVNGFNDGFSLFLNCRPKTMTQGDRLNAIKAKKQTQSCGSMPVEKLKGHVRVKSVPSRVANGGMTHVSHHHSSSSGAKTSAALSPSRPMTRMQAEAAAGAKSPKRSSALVTSRKSNAVR